MSIHILGHRVPDQTASNPIKRHHKWEQYRSLQPANRIMGVLVCGFHPRAFILLLTHMALYSCCPSLPAPPYFPLPVAIFLVLPRFTATVAAGAPTMMSSLGHRPVRHTKTRREREESPAACLQLRP